MTAAEIEAAAKALYEARRGQLDFDWDDLAEQRPRALHLAEHGEVPEHTLDAFRDAWAAVTAAAAEAGES